jgi:hypothetical protein
MEERHRAKHRVLPARASLATALLHELTGLALHEEHIDCTHDIAVGAHHTLGGTRSAARVHERRHIILMNINTGEGLARILRHNIIVGLNVHTTDCREGTRRPDDDKRADLGALRREQGE